MDNTTVTQCTEASVSRCTKCAFWHGPTLDGTAREAHAVWWLILLVVLLCAVALAVLVALVVAVNWLMKRQRAEDWAGTDDVCLCDGPEQRLLCLAQRRACCRHKDACL